MNKQLATSIAPLLALAVLATMATTAHASPPYHVYVANGRSDNVSQYESGSAGLLSALTPATAPAQDGPNDLAVSPDHKSLYVVNEDSETVSQYGFEPGPSPSYGALRPKTPATMKTGAFAVGIAAVEIGDTSYAYVAAQGNGAPWEVYQYKIGPTNGALEQLTPPTVNDGHPQPIEIAISPNRKYAYVTNEGDSTISEYEILATGELKALATPSINTGFAAEGIVVTPNGDNVYVAAQEVPDDPSNTTPGDVWQYKINATTGQLEHLATNFVVAGKEADRIALSPDGKFAYVTNYGAATVSEYEIPPSGELSQLPTSPVATGGNPVGVAVTPVTNRYVYVANQSSDSVSEYEIESTGGLKALGAVAAGEAPFGITVVEEPVPTEAEKHERLCGPPNSPGNQGTAGICNWYASGSLVPAGQKRVMLLSGELKGTANIGELTCKAVAYGTFENPVGGGPGVGELYGLDYYDCDSPQCDAAVAGAFPGDAARATATALNLPWRESLFEGGAPYAVRERLGLPFSGTFGSPKPQETLVKYVCEDGTTSHPPLSESISQGELEPEVGIGTGPGPGLNSPSASPRSEIAFTGLTSGQALEFAVEGSPNTYTGDGQDAISGSLKYLQCYPWDPMEVW